MGEEEKDKQRDNDPRIEVEIENDNTESSEDIDRPTDGEENVAGEESGASDGEEEIVVPNSLIEGYEEKLKEKEDRFLRLAAEFDNYKKRTAREFGELVKTANARLLRSLVEITDNFERAVQTDDNGEAGESYKKGVELIYNQMVDLLKKENVTPIEAVGQPFDPNVHEAMMQQPSEEYDEGVIIAEIQKGYRLQDKVLRHARVIVSSGQPQEENNHE